MTKSWGRRLGTLLTLSSLVLAAQVASQNEPDSAGTGTDTPAPTRPATERAADPNQGERLYMKNCANCHRADGRGGRQPTATGDPTPSFREASFWVGKTDSALVAVVESGVPNSSMVSFKDVLRRDEMLAVTRFVRRRFGVPRDRADTTEGTPLARADSADTSGARRTTE